MIHPFAPINDQPIGPDAAAEPDTFSLVVLPDTQKYVESEREFGLFTAQTHWIVANKDRLNIRFVLHEGDMVDNSKRQIEWERAREAMSILDGKVPYVIAVGNHDLDGPTTFIRTRGTKAFNHYFPASKYEHQPWYGGRQREHENDNYFVLFEHQDLKFMVISLEFAPPDDVLRWANQVVASHADRRVIVLTHCYLDMFNARATMGLINPHNFCLPNVNDGQQMWDGFVSRHANIFMVLSGHYPGVGRLTSTGVHGNLVYQITADYQTRLWHGRYGWLRIMEFSPDANKISVRTFSPYLNEYLDGADNEFELAYDMGGRGVRPRGGEVRSAEAPGRPRAAGSW